MSAPTATTIAPQEEKADRHDRAVEDREAYEYWGYLFKADKTGTEKLKGLLKGLKEVVNTRYEPSDNPDLTPTQLAHFYRSLHGNYDQLFLGTPSESIAFIYKSLGCLHSLQPLSQSTAFTEPTVPALKTDGWIMWQTIQLLLGPEEHSSFLMEAVQKWDVKDPLTGEVYPKILPRECFPLEPDKHMVAWYEGVSERLRKEAEEERHREIEAEQAEVKRLHHKAYRVEDNVTDDEGSVDSRGPALAYFRNPLYRHLDGRPSIVRKNSKRPALGPRPNSMMDKGKEAANTIGHVVRNIGSPHLWDGRGTSADTARDRDRERRRRSLPDNRHHYPGDPPPSAGSYNDVPPPHHSISPHEHRHHRRPSAQLDIEEDEWDADDGSPVYSPRPSPGHPRHHHARDSPRDRHGLRHSRSHEPTPSQKEYADYFSGHPIPDADRRNAAYEDPVSPPLHHIDTKTSNTGSIGGFGPSASPLFATHVARQPQPPPMEPMMSPPPDSKQRHPRYSSADPYAPKKSPSVRRTQQAGRPYSRSPADSDRRPDPRRYDSPPRHPRFEASPGPFSYDDDVGTPGPMPPSSDGRRHDRPPYEGPPLSENRRRSGKYSGSDISGPEESRERRSRTKQTRFAAGPQGVSGVDGRRYVNESPWR